MTNYTPHADPLFDVSAPILGSTGLEARDNLISVAEGEDPDAPKVQGTALDNVLIGSFEDADDVTGLGYVKEVVLHVSLGTDGGSSKSFSISFSDDGGSSYGSYQTLTAGITSGTVSAQRFQFFITLNLVTGAWTGQSFGKTTSSNVSGTLTPLAGCNAFKMNTLGQAYTVQILSGRS